MHYSVQYGRSSLACVFFLVSISQAFSTLGQDSPRLVPANSPPTRQAQDRQRAAANPADAIQQAGIARKLTYEEELRQMQQAYGAPAVRPARAPTLTQLVQAKLDLTNEKRQLIVMIESYRQETTQQMVTTNRIEEQEQDVTDAAGVVRKRTVRRAVPTTELRDVVTQVPIGRKPALFDVKDYHFFSLDGKELTVEEAAAKLNTLKPIFLLDNATGAPPALPELARQAMMPDCLIAVTEQSIRNVSNPYASVPRPTVAPSP